MMREREPRPDLPPLGADDELPAATGPTLVDWGLLVLRAAWRRKWIAAAVFVLCLDALAVYYRTRTPVYRVEARILAQRQQALPSVVRPAAPDDTPTRSAWELIHRRENLIALIREANLLPGPDAAPPAPGLLDRFRRALRGLSGNDGSSAASEDPMDALVRRLDKALEVTVAEGTITIAIDWPDAQQSYRLVEGALQNFLEARHLQEVTAIDEVISLLQGRTAAMREQLLRVSEETRRQAAREGSRLARVPTPQGQAVVGSEGLVRLKSMLDAKERAIADVEEFRRRRLADLQAQLDAQRGVYSEAHPSIISLRQDIEALSRDSPQIAALREEEAKLRSDYAARLAQEGHRPGASSTLLAAPGLPPPVPSTDENERVRDARFQYQQMVERLNAAQMDLDAARSAFKYRYNVIWPPEVPRTPVSPKAQKIFGLGALASLLLALFAAAAPDLRSGRIVERWQVERSLDLPIVGELGRK
jgi:uncharacterized protein involved in exopolysaccharide biosynthesis